MASVSFNPEFGSLSAETPVSFFTNQCDTCGKTFAHSSSYRRHARTQCDSQTRKRRRKLWLPDESCRSDKEDEDDGVAPLLNTVECQTEGKTNTKEDARGDLHVFNQDTGEESADCDDRKEECSFQEISESESEDEPITESCEEEDDLENGEESLLHWSEEDLQGMMQDLNEPIPEPPH